MSKTLVFLVGISILSFITSISMGTRLSQLESRIEMVAKQLTGLSIQVNEITEEYACLMQYNVPTSDRSDIVAYLDYQERSAQ